MYCVYYLFYLLYVGFNIKLFILDLGFLNIMVTFANGKSINVCLQNHLWLCTPLSKFSTSDLYAL